jgi:hypothetical protein
MDQDDSGNNQQDYQDISIKLTDNRWGMRGNSTEELSISAF